MPNGRKNGNTQPAQTPPSTEWVQDIRPFVGSKSCHKGTAKHIKGGVGTRILQALARLQFSNTLDGRNLAPPNNKAMYASKAKPRTPF